MEVNFDGLAGQTHHYGGYAFGNLASMRSKKNISYPKKAALQGLRKMKILSDLGIPQAVLPPRMRPSLKMLRALGFMGTDLEIFQQAASQNPLLLQMLSSSASMWAANTATYSPSTDTHDGKVHITIANLQSKFHRAIEADEAYRLLCLLFPNPQHFTIHPPLFSGGDFGDEGAANHTRFCKEYDQQGIHLFVYNKGAFDSLSSHFPYRHVKEASMAIARQHGLNPSQVVFAQQNSHAIERGVFHNDVISVGNRNVFLYHEKAFVHTELTISELQEKIPLKTICVTEEMITLEKAVQTYLFNSQIVTLPSGEDVLIAPNECQELKLDWLPLRPIFVDISESMHNGGGPACLRLRCVLNEKELTHVHPSILWSDALYTDLTNWVQKYYREEMQVDDLLDPHILYEVMEGLDALTQILRLGSFYEFQQAYR